MAGFWVSGFATHRVAARFGSPEDIRRVLGENSIAADQLQFLDLRLSDEHSIERITMWPRQCACRQGVIEADGQDVETFFAQITWQILNNVGSQWQLAQLVLDRQFPTGCRAHENALSAVSDGCLRDCAEIRRVE